MIKVKQFFSKFLYFLFLQKTPVLMHFSRMIFPVYSIMIFLLFQHLKYFRQYPSAQHIFEHAFKKAGLEKKASMHSLHHTFATHLLENGYDICKIKELLGHSSVITTERYTKVANLKSSRVKSPLDMLDEPDPTDD